MEPSQRRLKAGALDLFQLHRIDPHLEMAEQFGVMAEMQSKGIPAWTPPRCPWR